jgi:hypothetical protein
MRYSDMRITGGKIAPMSEAGRFAKPYFSSEEKWKDYGLLITVMVFNLITVYGQVLNRPVAKVGVFRPICR